MNDRDRMIALVDTDDDSVTCVCSVGSLLDANEDAGFDDNEIAAMLAGEVVMLGGGAQPSFIVRPAFPEECEATR